MNEGIFIRELKNRFLCEVQMDDALITCYVPASCRLSNFGDFSGCKVLLVENSGIHSKTKYSLYAIYQNRKYVIVNLKEANRIIEANIHKRIFSFLGSRKNVRRERKFDDYKCDLFIEDTGTVIEIKSVIMFENNNEILQIHSDRAIMQLKSMHQLLKEGYKVCYFFVSMNPIAKELVLTADNSELHYWMRKNILEGMICKAYAVGISQGHAVLRKEIKFRYNDQAKGD